MTDRSKPDGGWTGGFRFAYRKGRQARRYEQARESCPYSDHRTIRGGVTFSRAWMHAWLAGWDMEQDVIFHSEPEPND